MYDTTQLVHILSFVPPQFLLGHIFDDPNRRWRLDSYSFPSNRTRAVATPLSVPEEDGPDVIDYHQDSDQSRHFSYYTREFPSMINFTFYVSA